MLDLFKFPGINPVPGSHDIAQTPKTIPCISFTYSCFCYENSLITIMKGVLYYLTKNEVTIAPNNVEKCKVINENNCVLY